MLDDYEKIKSIDRSNMLGAVKSLPDQIDDVYGKSLNEIYAVKPSKIVIAGMGGSAIGGDFLKTIIHHQTDFIVYVNRSYNLPKFVDDETLFVAVSYSGNTEETISSYKDAKKAGCMCYTISSGGLLKKMSDESHHIDIPSNFQPRAAFGYLLGCLLIIMRDEGLLKIDDDVEECVKMLRGIISTIDYDVPFSENLSKQIAAQLCGGIPIIHAPEILEPSAIRWKTQLNENSKILCYHSIFPEMNHNEIVGWKYHEKKHEMMPVYLVDKDVHTRISTRMKVTPDVSDIAFGPILVISKGEKLLTKLLSLSLVGDFTSVYLAILRNIDPTPVEVISQLKDILRNQ